MGGWDYPHMCRDGHEEIGHLPSNHEKCPLCRALAKIEELEAAAKWEKNLGEARRVAQR